MTQNENNNKNASIQELTNQISIIPYQSSPYLKSVSNKTNIDQIFVQIFDEYDKHNSDQAYPLIIYDQCSMIFDQEMQAPPNNSRWIQMKQSWMHLNKKEEEEEQKYISNTSKKGRRFEWNKKEQYINTKHDDSIPFLKNHKFTNEPIDIKQIWQIYQENIDYIQNYLTKNDITKSNYTSVDYDASILNTISSKFDLNKKSKSLGCTTIQCMEPGYIECFQRNPLDMWKIHLMMEGRRLLFVTDELNAKQTAIVHKHFNHVQSCPINALSPQQDEQYLPKLDTILNLLKRINKRLHVVLLHPGNLSVIKGNTFSFSLSVHNCNAWSKSIIFAPDESKSLRSIQMALISHQEFQKNPNDCIKCSRTGFIGDKIGYELTDNENSDGEACQHFQKLMASAQTNRKCNQRNRDQYRIQRIQRLHNSNLVERATNKVPFLNREPISSQ